MNQSISPTICLSLGALSRRRGVSPRQSRRRVNPLPRHRRRWARMHRMRARGLDRGRSSHTHTRSANRGCAWRRRLAPHCFHVERVSLVHEAGKDTAADARNRLVPECQVCRAAARAVGAFPGGTGSSTGVRNHCREGRQDACDTASGDACATARRRDVGAVAQASRGVSPASRQRLACGIAGFHPALSGVGPQEQPSICERGSDGGRPMKAPGSAGALRFRRIALVSRKGIHE